MSLTDSIQAASPGEVEPRDVKARRGAIRSILAFLIGDHEKVGMIARKRLDRLGECSLLDESLKARLAPVLVEHETVMAKRHVFIVRDALFGAFTGIFTTFLAAPLSGSHGVWLWFQASLQAALCAIYVPWLLRSPIAKGFQLESVLAHATSTLLVYIDEHQHELSALEKKRQLVKQLEKLASLVEGQFPRRCGKLDGESSERLKLEGTTVARALRAKKIWVCLPKPDTAANLSSALGETLYLFATRDWYSLTRSAHEELVKEGYPESLPPAPRRWTTLLGHLLRILIVCSAMAAVVFVAVTGHGSAQDVAKRMMGPVLLILGAQLLRLLFGDKALPVKELQAAMPGDKSAK